MSDGPALRRKVLRLSPGAVISVAMIVVPTVGTAMTDCPRYAAWLAQEKGEAELAQADQNRQIALV